jgi:anti-anti-sigma factor
MTVTLAPRTVICPGPRLDLETADAFRADIDAFLASDAPGVVVDLSPTHQMDVVGLAALAYLLVRSRAADRPMALAGPISAPVQRLVDYTGFDALFEAA